MTFYDRLIRVSNAALCAFQKWWRPIGCAGIVASIWTNGVVLPLINHQQPDLSAMAVFCSTFAALAGIREWAKIKGTD